jgi:hypothetical protein
MSESLAGVNMKQINITHLFAEDPNELNEGFSLRRLHLHDIHANLKRWRFRITWSEGHCHQSIVMRYIERDWRIKIWGGLRGIRYQFMYGKGHVLAMNGFPASVDAKVMALLATPRSLSSILGNRRPMRHPLARGIIIGQKKGNIAYDKHLPVDRIFGYEPESESQAGGVRFDKSTTQLVEDMPNCHTV